jgi:Xaa-Pro dipeptidase
MDGILYNPERVAAAMDAEGVEALVATTAPNVQYLTRYRRGSTLALLRRADLGRPTLIVGSGNLAYCLEDPSDAVEVRPHGIFYRSFAEGVEWNAGEAFIKRHHEASRPEATAWSVLAEALTEAGLQAAMIAVDGTLDSLAPLAKLLPNLKVCSLPELFRRLRMVKTPEEVARMAEAARITEHAVLTSVQSAFLGCTQRQLARVYNLTVVTANASTRQDNASIDRGSTFGNANTPGDIVQDGSIIRYDVGVHYQGYASDYARCYQFRTPSDKVRRIQDALVVGLERALEKVRPGATASDIFHTAIEGVRKAGLPDFERTHCGHGLGIAGAGYEPPLIAAKDNTPLEAGMVLCVETPYTEMGFGGLQVEDMLVVTPDGYRLMTHTERGITVVP